MNVLCGLIDFHVYNGESMKTNQQPNTRTNRSPNAGHVSSPEEETPKKFETFQETSKQPAVPRSGMDWDHKYEGEDLLFRLRACTSFPRFRSYELFTSSESTSLLARRQNGR